MASYQNLDKVLDQATDRGRNARQEKYKISAEKLITLSTEKVKAAKESANSAKDLDFAFLEAREELELILKNMVEVEEFLEDFYKLCAGATFEAVDRDQNKDQVMEIKQAALDFVEASHSLKSEVDLYHPTIIQNQSLNNVLDTGMDNVLDQAADRGRNVRQEIFKISAEKLITLSTEKVEAAKEIANSAKELDFAPEDLGYRNLFLEVKM